MTTKDKVEKLLGHKNLSLSRFATEIGERKQTIAYRLEHPDSSTDETFWPRVAAKLGVSMSTLLEEAEELPAWVLGGKTSGSRLPMSAELLDMLLEIIENPNAGPEHKETAKHQIKMWLKDFLH